jgi:hypothetical protein
LCLDLGNPRGRPYLMTIPECAHPPRKGVEVETASVSKSPVLTVPLIAKTTFPPARSTAT